MFKLKIETGKSDKKYLMNILYFLDISEIDIGEN